MTYDGDRVIRRVLAGRSGRGPGAAGRSQPHLKAKRAMELEGEAAEAQRRLVRGRGLRGSITPDTSPEKQFLS